MPSADTAEFYTALCYRYSRIDIPQKPNRYSNYRQLDAENSVGSLSACELLQSLFWPIFYAHAHNSLQNATYPSRFLADRTNGRILVQSNT